jgi:hypothetical protein
MLLECPEAVYAAGRLVAERNAAGVPALLARTHSEPVASRRLVFLDAHESLKKLCDSQKR